MSPVLTALIVLVVGVLCCVAGFFVGETHRRKTAEQKIGSAEEEAKRIVNEAIKTAEP